MFIFLFFSRTQLCFYHQHEEWRGRNGTWTTVCMISSLAAVLWALPSTDFTWMRVSNAHASCLQSSLSENWQIPGGNDRPKKNMSPRDICHLTKEPLRISRPFLIQVRRNNKCLSVNLIWGGENECSLWMALIRQHGLCGSILDIACILVLTFQDTVTAFLSITAMPSLTSLMGYKYLRCIEESKTKTKWTERGRHLMLPWRFCG